MKAKQRGLALILVLDTLAVLALFAPAFATLSGVERRVSRNYLDGVRAHRGAWTSFSPARGSWSRPARRRITRSSRSWARR